MNLIYIILAGDEILAYIYEREETKEKVLVFKSDKITVDHKLRFFDFKTKDEVEMADDLLNWVFQILLDFQNVKAEGS